ncbi:MAG: 30S ribosome-binding factor RbfA [Candidatus Dormibacteraeota bacterium]|nr:30S ribosome-binding factor RbfA [Candidatus Dormibacteraeota bacterium]
MAREGTSPYRMDRLNAQLQQELAMALARDVKDPRLDLVTVIAVECTRDLSEAKVRVSPLGDDNQRELALKTLRGMEGYLRHLLGERLENLRRVPHLVFRLDDSIAHGVRVGVILNELARDGGLADSNGR